MVSEISAVEELAKNQLAIGSDQALMDSQLKMQDLYYTARWCPSSECGEVTIRLYSGTSDRGHFKPFNKGLSKSTVACTLYSYRITNNLSTKDKILGPKCVRFHCIPRMQVIEVPFFKICHSYHPVASYLIEEELSYGEESLIAGGEISLMGC